MYAPAECELEGGEEQLERDRDSATHGARRMPQWFAGALLMLPVCLTDTARAACSLSVGTCIPRIGTASPWPGLCFVAQGRVACLRPAAALQHAVHP